MTRPYLRHYLVAHSSRTRPEYPNNRKPANDAVQTRPITDTGCAVPVASSNDQIQVDAVPARLHLHILKEGLG